MSNSPEHDFWSSQTSSLHRADLPDIYRAKAAEHASIMTRAEREAVVLDIACGAGELLEQLRALMNVRTGIDYSDSMIAAAEARLNGSGIALIKADVFDYLPTTDAATWMTTGGINQYLDGAKQSALLEIFKQNVHARSYFLYDCVDPLRYQLLWSGLSYRPLHVEAATPAWKRYVLRLQAIASLAIGRYERPQTKMRGDGMGYGFRPSFWRAEAEKLGLNVSIVSSQQYEYRYHVVVRK
jgi:SAM-dependent methyltransferase